MQIEDALRSLDGTVATATSGLPLVLHHGTFASFQRFGVTRDIGFHFGSVGQAMSRETQARSEQKPGRTAAWRVISVGLRIENPVILDADPQTWEPSLVAGLVGDRINPAAKARWKAEHETLMAAATPEWKRIRDALEAGTSNLARLDNQIYNASQAYWRPAKSRSMASLREAIVTSGYDGLCYRNWYERKHEVSWVAFDADQIVVLGDNLGIDELRASDMEVAAAGYARRTNPVVPLAKGVRLPNRIRPTHPDTRRLRAQIDAVVSARGGKVASKFNGYPEYDAEWEIPTQLGRVLLKHWGQWSVDLSLDGFGLPIPAGEAGLDGCHGRDHNAMSVEWKWLEMPRDAAIRLEGALAWIDRNCIPGNDLPSATPGMR